MKKTVILLFYIFVTFSINAHPWKPSHYVIIDTDGGIDDIRTITMLLASPDVRVLGITISPGALNTGSAYLKVRSLVNSFHHEGIMVGINRNCNFISPDFQTAHDMAWGEESGIACEDAPGSTSLIKEILSAESNKVSFLCLGSMSTVASAVKELPAFKEVVKEIIWSSDISDDKKGFNFSINISSSEQMLKGDIPVNVIRGLRDEIYFNKELIEAISLIPTVYAQKIFWFFTSDIAKNHRYSFMANDEMVALYLHYPMLFQKNTITNNIEPIAENINLLREKALVILAGETVSKNQVIKKIPVDTSFYFADINPFVTDIVQKFGIDEWISGVIANELHRHLGVFAIVGVKMGIRAREYFNTGVDEFRVTTFAGSSPPLSCMNDGLQVSTGATPGHGLLTVREDTIKIPSAEFSYMNRKIRLTLKPEYANKISSELKEINFVYGLDSNIYWELVRKNSIIYWLNLDRHEVFLIEEIR